MDNWIHTNLNGDERIDCSDTGYINNRIIMEYGDHLIEHSRAGPNKPWKLLLCDGHESHRFDPFVLKLAENHIKIFWFPSHLTHILQPLDVGIFRPWKHFHNLCIQAALRNLDFEYTISSFFRDLTTIRKQALKPYTIKNAFREAGMWPLSLKAGLLKMRSYQKKKRSIQDVENEDQDLDLPKLPPLRPDQLWSTVSAVQSFIGRDPTQFSDPSRELFQKTMVNTAVSLYKAHLTTIEHASLQEKIKADNTRKKTSRRSIHKGGASANIGDLRQRIRIRDEAERGEALRKARKALQQAINRSTEALRTAGVQARKVNKEKKKRLAICKANGIPLAAEDLIPCREPDKQPTILEAASKTPEGHPEYLHMVLQLEKDYNGELVIDREGEGEDIEFKIGNTHKQEGISIVYPESSPPRELYKESSDSESDAGSIDSISRNADFVQLFKE